MKNTPASLSFYFEAPFPPLADTATGFHRPPPLQSGGAYSGDRLEGGWNGALVIDLASLVPPRHLPGVAVTRPRPDLLRAPC
jgi:hypothetical protein